MGYLKEILTKEKPSSILADIDQGKRPKSDFDPYYNRVLAGGIAQEDLCKEFIECWTSNSKTPIRDFISDSEVFHGYILEDNIPLNKNLYYLFYDDPEYALHFFFANEKTTSSALNKLKSFVKDSGLSPEDFAKKYNWNFKNMLEFFNQSFFEDWNEKSIPAGSMLVEICDFLGVKVKPLDTTPEKWSIDEYTFEEWVSDCRSAKSKSAIQLKNFARLFSLPPTRWYKNTSWTHYAQ